MHKNNKTNKDRVNQKRDGESAVVHRRDTNSNINSDKNHKRISKITWSILFSIPRFFSIIACFIGIYVLQHTSKLRKTANQPTKKFLRFRDIRILPNPMSTSSSSGASVLLCVVAWHIDIQMTNYARFVSSTSRIIRLNMWTVFQNRVVKS